MQVISVCPDEEKDKEKEIVTVSHSAVIGNSSILTCFGTGTPPLSVRWRFDNQTIPDRKVTTYTEELSFHKVQHLHSMVFAHFTTVPKMPFKSTLYNFILKFRGCFLNHSLFQGQVKSGVDGVQA